MRTDTKNSIARDLSVLIHGEMRSIRDKVTKAQWQKQVGANKVDEKLSKIINLMEELKTELNPDQDSV